MARCSDLLLRLASADRGIATDHCVKATARDGVRAGFAVRVLLDCTAGVAADTTSTAISELRQAGVALSGKPVVLA